MEDLLTAWDGETSHGMVKAILFFNMSKQLLKWRVLQVGDGNNTSLLSFSNIHNKMAFWHITAFFSRQKNTLHNLLSIEQTDTHDGQRGNKKSLMERDECGAKESESLLEML